MKRTHVIPPQRLVKLLEAIKRDPNPPARYWEDTKNRDERLRSPRFVLREWISAVFDPGYAAALQRKYHQSQDEVDYYADLRSSAEAQLRSVQDEYLRAVATAQEMEKQVAATGKEGAWRLG
jgi:hypothetical protein